MRKKLLLVSALALLGLACVAPTRTSFGVSASYGTRGYYGPNVYTTDDYPGWLYVDGQYRWVGGRQIWMDGYWVEDRPAYIYRPGYYHPRSRVWVTGRWEPRRHRQHVYLRAPHGERIYHSAPPPRRRHY
jgi:hypothetical protein